MDFDEEILNVFKNARKDKGKKEISVETLSMMTGIRAPMVDRKLHTMSNFGYVRPARKKTITVWELTD